MFSSLWAKLSGIFGGISALLFILLKFKNKEIDNLKDENAGLIKKDEITKEQDKANDKAESDEKEAIENIDTSNWKSNI